MNPKTFTGHMFVGDEVVLDVRLAFARARLANLARGDLLQNASQDAYGLGITGLSRVGSLGLSREVRVQARELTERDGSAGLAIRWEVTGPGGGLFPILDADIRLFSTGEQATLVTMAGAYRPPLGSVGQVLDRAILHRVAAATIRNFLGRVAAGIMGQPGGAEAGADPSPLPFAPEMS